jgi:hypothetical protein
MQKHNIQRKQMEIQFTNMNFTTPNFHARIKLYKRNTPTRPVINWRNVSPYELTEHINIITQPSILTYDILNSIHFIKNPQTMEINQDRRMYSFDIKDM